jgi:hypothetical protein
MSKPMRFALRAAIVGALVGAYFVINDHSADWWRAAGPMLAIARISGGIIAGVILGGAVGYAVGLRRRNSK